MEFYYINKSDNYIEDIFNCLSIYDVLIDIGAVFINYTNDQIKNKYKNLSNRKKYFVYFDNGIKIYNLDIDNYVLIDTIKKDQSDIFYYFSNKHITGVDAKQIMNLLAHGLITINNKTIY